MTHNKVMVVPAAAVRPSLTLAREITMTGNIEKCDIAFDEGGMHEGYESHLYRDGFGGCQGFVRAKDGSHLIIKNIDIH